ncbi:uncharacterized protein [Triticum aestivum]|uniref:uncharacterized protein isoform X2 n=1 Tax=Triticum aestivum TaxID=4565 RepID=UPI001D0191A2|nr:uncharacterized protein LOC123166023 isoform X2 [Triticum aestivum]
MGKLQKVSHQDVPLMSSFESADSIREPFVPNDFAEDGSYPMSTKGKSLKRKLSSVRRRNVESLNVFFIEVFIVILFMRGGEGFPFSVRSKLMASREVVASC